MSFVAGSDPLIGRIVKALGITKPTQRIILDIKCDEVVKAYVTYLPVREELEKLAEVFEADTPVVIECDHLGLADGQPECTVMAFQKEVVTISESKS